MFEMRVECPRCGRYWLIPHGQPDIDCNCHLFCVDGDKPSDCTLVGHESGSVDPWTGIWNWPQGLHVDALHEGDDTQARVRYCTTHDKYVDKVPITIEANWERWFSKRAPKRLRMSHGKY